MALKSRTKKDKVETKVAETKVETPAAEVVEPEAAPEETKEVVVQKPAAVPAFGGQFKTALQEFDNAFDSPPPAFTFPPIVANEGQIMSEGESLGKEIVVSIISYNNLFIITPNDNKADGSLCGFSWDNKVLNDGSDITVSEKIQDLKDEGYKDASSKNYVELHCMLEDADEDHEAIGEIVTLRLSPQSVKNWERFKLGSTVKIKQGKMNPEDVTQLKVTAKSKTFNKNTFTIFTFSPAAG